MKIISPEIGQNIIDTAKTYNPIKKHKRSIKNKIKDNNQNNEKGNIFKRLTIILIVISILLVIAVISLCLLLFLRKNSVKEHNSTETEESVNLVNSDENVDINDADKNGVENVDRNADENVNENVDGNANENVDGNANENADENVDGNADGNVDENADENEPIIISIKDLSFNEIESLMESGVVEKNQILLNGIKDRIDNLLNVYENPNLEQNQINPNISFILPDFLQNATKPALKIAKSDIILYKRKYEELAKNINDFAYNISYSLQNLSFSLGDLRNEINEVFSQFEETFKNLCIPLILIQKLSNNKTRRLDIDNEIEEYKNETDNLNNLYNELFEYISQETQIIEDEIKEIPNITLDIQNKIENDIFKYNEIINNITEPDDIESIHDNLIDIKSSFLSTKNYLNDKRNYLEEKINNFDNEYRNRQLDFDQFKVQNDEIIENIIESSNNIINSIISSNENNSIIEVPDLNASSIISEHIIHSIYKTYQVIKEEEIETSQGIIRFISIINVEEKTSLDLLFVMDITGSMKNYLEQAKKNVIDIINRILNECPGIDINLGYIGYKDFLDINDYVNIDFTKEYQTLQNKIKNVQATGGEGDGPEDVAWAMEMALYKDWKNNARFLIFIADAPCHGWKYHNLKKDKYPNMNNRRNIEDLIKELAEKDISLFCLKITELTNKMFDMFKNIYNNYPNCEFKIVPMNSGQSLDNIVVNSAVEVYVSQRNVDL